MHARDDDLRECQLLLKHEFADVSYLRRALVHASAAATRVDSNERLEFLGDAIFGAVVCDALYARYPDKDEGELTRIKSAVVSRTACTRVTIALGLHEYVVLGKGVASKSGRIPGSILAAVFEAVVAAIYLDAGYPAAKKFILHCFDDEMARAIDHSISENYKSELQQVAQREFGTTPTYEVVEESGPDHLKSFRICAVIGGRRFESAWGANKKVAEQQAAANALSELTSSASEDG